MKTSQIAITFACIAAAVATPIAAAGALAPAQYVEHSREAGKHTNGTLIWYGPPAGTQANAARAIRTCTTSGESMTCSLQNTARNAVCDDLVVELNGDGNTHLLSNLRQVCYDGGSESNQYCCVSWSDDLGSSAVKSQLAGPAQAIEQQCTTSGISGKIGNIKLNKICTTCACQTVALAAERTPCIPCLEAC